MSTTRTIRTSSLPVVLDADLAAIDLHVYTEARSDGEVTVSTVDNDGPSAGAVRAATLDVDGNRLVVRVDHAAGGTTIIQTGRGGSSYVSTGSGQNIVVGNGVTMVNGRVVSGNGTFISGGSPVTVVARLPHGSSVRARTQSGDIDLEGNYDEVDASSQSGDIEVGTVRVVQARTQSGDVDVATLTGSGALESMSGDIEVRGPQGASASARTMSGNVRGSGGIRVAGSSMSGRVRT
jgi:hypothetical protein